MFQNQDQKGVEEKILQGWRTRIRERREEERILLGWRTRIREESRRKNITGMENQDQREELKTEHYKNGKLGLERKRKSSSSLYIRRMESQDQREENKLERIFYVFFCFK